MNRLSLIQSQLKSSPLANANNTITITDNRTGTFSNNKKFLLLKFFIKKI